jgi:hypothetical protein
MPDSTPENSTNVRFAIEGAAPAWLGASVWWLLVAALTATGSITTLASDLPAIAAFMCAVAVLAYVVDVELRQALGRLRTPRLVKLAAIALASCTLGPAAWLAFSPIAAVLAIALVDRARGAKLSSAAAASPGARRGAL